MKLLSGLCAAVTEGFSDHHDSFHHLALSAREVIFLKSLELEHQSELWWSCWREIHHHRWIPGQLTFSGRSGCWWSDLTPETALCSWSLFPSLSFVINFACFPVKVSSTFSSNEYEWQVHAGIRCKIQSLGEGLGENGKPFLGFVLYCRDSMIHA